MNAPFQPSYTNEVLPEFLSRLNNSPFTEEQLAGFDDEVMAIIHQQLAYAEEYPPCAIYRVATEGSQTRDGGVIINTPQGGYLFIAREGVSIAEDFLPSTIEEEIR